MKCPTGHTLYTVLLALLLFAISETLPAQTTTIHGRVMDAATGRPASRVYVRICDEKRKTDKDGHFNIPGARGADLTVSDVAQYHGRTIPYRQYRGQEPLTIYITPNVRMRSNVATSPGTETIYHVDFENALDCAYLGDTLVVLSYMRSRASTSYAGTRYFGNTLTFLKYGKVVERLTLPDYAMGLHVDPFGKMYVVGEGFYLQALRPATGTLLDTLAEEYYESKVAPLTAQYAGRSYYRSYGDNLPREGIYMVPGQRAEMSPVREIQNEAYFRNVPGEYQLLNEGQRRQAAMMATEPGIDDELYAPLLRQAQTNTYYARPATPTFAIGERLVIFDDMNGWIFTHDSLGQPTDSMPMYFQAFADEDYNGIIQDPFTARCYTVHERAGVHYLRLIDPATGAAGGAFKVRFPYPRRLHIYEGWVYYTYREFGSEDTYKLVRERLPKALTGGSAGM